MKDIKGYINKQIDIPCLQKENLNTVKMSEFTNLTCTLNAIPKKFPENCTNKFSSSPERGKKKQKSQHNIEEQSWRTEPTNLKT